VTRVARFVSDFADQAVLPPLATEAIGPGI